MELRQLRQFLAVAETLNFHRAAMRLHIAQPPLSIAIRRLEESLGAKLFERTSRAVKLTDAGRAALQSARNAVFHADQFRETVAQATGGSVGKLRMHFVCSSMVAFLPRALARFHMAYPKVQLDLHEDDTRSVVAFVQAGETDLGVVRTPTPVFSSVAIIPIHADRYVIALPKTHSLAKNKRLRLANFSGEPFILPSDEIHPTLHLSIVAACHQAGFSPRIVQQGFQVQTILALVESGLGVALVPEIWGRMAAADITLRPLVDQKHSTTGLAFAHRTEALTDMGRRMIEFSKEASRSSAKAPR
jgi:DNA-binding transcriptional LysR family regulator